MQMYAQFSRHKKPKLVHGGFISKFHRNSNGKAERFSTYCRVIGEDYSGYFGSRNMSFNLNAKSMKFGDDIPENIRHMIEAEFREETKRRKIKRIEIVKEIKTIQEVMRDKLQQENNNITFAFQDVYKRHQEINFDFYKKTGSFNNNLIKISFDTLRILIKLGFVAQTYNPHYLKHRYYHFNNEYSFPNKDIQSDFPLTLIN